MKSSFSVDVAGLLEALTDQFPEPLLCVRELVQNSADAQAKRIDIDVAYDAKRQLVRLSVKDDGTGMSANDIEDYLTIGYSHKSSKKQHRGRFGIGKLSPYALGLKRMTVETCDGYEAHKITFFSNGSGTCVKLKNKPRGTTVKVYKQCQREEAEQITEATYTIVQQTCGSLNVPLLVNGVTVNQAKSLPTLYQIPIKNDQTTAGFIGICAEPVQLILSGGIVLESNTAILGNKISYILDSPELTPTLSRNSIRRDQSFDRVLRTAQTHVNQLEDIISLKLIERFHQIRLTPVGDQTISALSPEDTAAIDWIRDRILQTESTQLKDTLRKAPVLETADGNFVSIQNVFSTVRGTGRVPVSRVPRSPEEISGYIDRGQPVLLLYQDVEDFLLRHDIAITEVDGFDNGSEIPKQLWTPGEVALIKSCESVPQISQQKNNIRYLFAAVFTFCAVLLAGRIYTDTNIFQNSPQQIPATTLMLSTAFVGCWIFFRQGFKSSRTPQNLMYAKTTPKHWATIVHALTYPIDFWVARRWSIRGAGTFAVSKYSRTLEDITIRTGVHLNLDQLSLGYVDLLSRAGDPTDTRFLIVREDKVLLNRNHSTILNLTTIAQQNPTKASILLETLLSTEIELTKACDPRQVEWNLVARSEQKLSTSHKKRTKDAKS